jgi:hypothetical protein
MAVLGPALLAGAGGAHGSGAHGSGAHGGGAHGRGAPRSGDPSAIGDGVRAVGIGCRSAVAAALAHEIAGTLAAHRGTTDPDAAVAHAGALFAAVASPALPDDASIDLRLARSARMLAMRGVHAALVDTILAARAVSDASDDMAMTVRLAVDLAHGPPDGAIAPVLHAWLRDAGISHRLPEWQARYR